MLFIVTFNELCFLLANLCMVKEVLGFVSVVSPVESNLMLIKRGRIEINGSLGRVSCEDSEQLAYQILGHSEETLSSLSPRHQNKDVSLWLKDIVKSCFKTLCLMATGHQGNGRRGLGNLGSNLN